MKRKLCRIGSGFRGIPLLRVTWFSGHCKVYEWEADHPACRMPESLNPAPQESSGESSSAEGTTTVTKLPMVIRYEGNVLL